MMSERAELDEVVKQFLMESYERLDRLDRDLVALAQSPGSRDVLASIFRAIHGLRGTCGFLGFDRLEAVARSGESLLAILRDGSVRVDADRTRALQGVVDTVRQTLASIASTGREGERDDAHLIETLAQLTPIETRPSAAVPDPTSPKPVAKRRAPALKTRTRKEVAGAPKTEPETIPPARVARAKTHVDLALLDPLMHLVGELVLARNHLRYVSADRRDPGLATASRRLNLIATELHEGVLRTRRQTIGSAWTRLPRLVRDRSLASGRKVRLELEGRDVELDKTIVEAIKEPLAHLVRNAVDHGIEPSDVRAAAEKPPEGRLLLRAQDDGARITIEVRDDGAGLQAETVRKTALERGLVTAEQAARMDDRDALKLIFLPGFDGNGICAAHAEIERVGGSIEVQSSVGTGTTFTISLPPTLAIISALIVGSGGERYVIPQANVLELVRVEAFLGTPAYSLRGKPLPLVHLDQVLGVRSTRTPEAAADIVVLQSGATQFGLVVERVHDTEEIVVKPLGKQLRDIPVFGGATIRGDGRVALVLEVARLAQHAHPASQAEATMPEAKNEEPQRREDHARETLLLVTLGPSDRAAIPLGQIARVEEFPSSTIERLGGREVVYYDGTSMPLVRLSEALGLGAIPRRTKCQVVVCRSGGRRIGLIVESILDIVPGPTSAEERSRCHVVDVDALVGGADTPSLETAAGMVRA